MKINKARTWLLLLCFITVNASQNTTKPSFLLTQSNSNSEKRDNDDNENAVLKRRQQKLNELMLSISAIEIKLNLPNKALFPLAEVLLNNYPEQIKKYFQEFTQLAGSARLQLEKFNQLPKLDTNTAILDSAQELVTEASELSSKLLAVTIGRDELRKHLLDLAENLSFEQSYNAINKLLTFSSKYKLLKLTNPVILNLLSLYLNLTPTDATLFGTTNMFGTRDHSLASNEEWIASVRHSVNVNENQTSIQDLVWHAAVPILAAQHSSEEHAHNLTNPKQLLFFVATICQYLKPLITLTPRLQQLLFIKKSPRDRTIEAFAGLFGASLVAANTLYDAQKKYFHTKNNYPFSTSQIKKIEDASKAWQKILQKKSFQNIPAQNLKTNNNSFTLSTELIDILRSSIDRQKE